MGTNHSSIQWSVIDDMIPIVHVEQASNTQKRGGSSKMKARIRGP